MLNIKNDTRKYGWYSYYFVTYFASINRRDGPTKNFTVTNQYQPAWGSSFAFCLRSRFAKVITSTLHLVYSP